MYEHLIGMLKVNEVEYQTQADLKALCSIRIGGVAGIVIFPDTEKKLVSVIEYLTNSGEDYRLVGNMTNIVPPDKYFYLPIISTRRLRGYSIKDGFAVAMAGESIFRILNSAAPKNLGGPEPLCGIPGTVGGLVAMNAGAFGKEISDFLIDATVYDKTEGKTKRLSASEMRFSYRSSVLRDGNFILLSARFKLFEKPYSSIISDLREYRERRIFAQPTEPSCGSVFMRCGDIIPARIIDALGLRGLGMGGAVVSKKHAGFIVNLGNATAEDFCGLVERIKSEASVRLGVTLKEEVEYL